jgi:hypothetical protein
LNCMASQPKEESQACMASQPKEESQACMASQPKEESQSDPVEDEVLIMNVLRKVGFHAQQRCRMLLLDTRLCYLADCDLRPWLLMPVASYPTAAAATAASDEGWLSLTGLIHPGAECRMSFEQLLTDLGIPPTLGGPEAHWQRGDVSPILRTAIREIHEVCARALARERPPPSSSAWRAIP